MSGIIAQNTLDNSGLIKSPAGGGAWNFISKVTASASSDISFTSGIDSTYKEYLFTFKNIHPSASADFQFNLSTDSGSNYNVTKTTTVFTAYNNESGTDPYLEYGAGPDLAQSTAFQKMVGHTNIGSGNDQNLGGYLHLFNPSSTTFVKHFITNTNSLGATNYSVNTFVAGYGNTTSAVDAVQFKMVSGDIDLGDICLYGLTT